MNFFSAWGLPAIVAVIMFAMGLGLRPADFAAVAARPKGFLVGAAAQLVLLPTLALAVVHALGITGGLAVGFMIIAAAPGGPMSNLLTHLGHGDTALSISLTAVISMISILTLPLIVALALPSFMGAAAPELSLAGTVMTLSAMTLLPVLAGMTLRGFWPAQAIWLEPFMRRLAIGFFLLFLVAAIWLARDLVRAHLLALAPGILLLNLSAMSAAFLLAKAARLSPPRVIALTIECGIQNGSLAMFVGATLLDSEAMMLPGAAYGVLMFPSALLFVALVLRGERRLARAEAEATE
ncbi:MAG: bile acid:sodium symporter family protein [Rhodothalassiaceae bacterium]